MPINIITADHNGKIANLCDEIWEMSDQIYALEEWLKENIDRLPKGNYIADIGYSVGENATGGGGVISLEMMTQMITLGMELYLSEYSVYD